MSRERITAYVGRLYKATTNYPPGYKFKFHSTKSILNCEVYSKETDEDRNSSIHYWAKVEGFTGLRAFQEHQMVKE